MLHSLFFICAGCKLRRDKQTIEQYLTSSPEDVLNTPVVFCLNCHQFPLFFLILKYPIPAFLSEHKAHKKLGIHSSTHYKQFTEIIFPYPKSPSEYTYNHLKMYKLLIVRTGIITHICCNISIIKLYCKIACCVICKIFIAASHDKSFVTKCCTCFIIDCCCVFCET